MARFQDLTGERFGRWTVLRRGENKKNHVAWVCRCVCGKEKTIVASVLKNGHSKGCGCGSKEYVKQKYPKIRKKHPLYPEYMQIKWRCYNKNSQKYKNYGGRGIRMANEWLEDFWSFAAYLESMPHYGEPGYSLDRINVNGNYEPGNVRWATWKEQERNKTTHRYLTAFGEKKILAEWAEEKGINYSTLLSRINRGWSAEEALSTKGCDSNARTVCRRTSLAGASE